MKSSSLLEVFSIPSKHLKSFFPETTPSILNAIAQGYLSLKLPSPLASSHPFLTQYKDLPVQAKAQVQVDFPILKKLELEPARRSSRNLVKKSERKKLGSSTNQPEKAAAVKRAAIKHGKGKGGSSRKRKHELVIEKLDVNERESRDLSCELSDDSEEESDDNDELIVTSSLGETRGGGREEELKREARGLAEAEVGLNHQSKSLKKAPIENVLQLFSQFCQLGPRGRAVSPAVCFFTRLLCEFCELTSSLLSDSRSCQLRTQPYLF